MHFNIIFLLSLLLSSSSLPSRVPTRNLQAFLFSPTHTAGYASLFSSFDHRNNIWRGVKSWSFSLLDFTDDFLTISVTAYRNNRKTLLRGTCTLLSSDLNFSYTMCKYITNNFVLFPQPNIMALFQIPWHVLAYVYYLTKDVAFFRKISHIYFHPKRLIN